MCAKRNVSVEIVEMASGESKGGGRSLKINYAFAATPFGEALLAATPKGICCLVFADDREDALAELKAQFPAAEYTEQMNPMLRDALSIFGDDTSAKITLHLKGTPFQLAVWRALVEIPDGELSTYSGIAARAGRPRACRATGSAVGANPVSVIVPCHRVVRSGGGLGGYRWGLDRKKALINHELERTI